MAAVAAPAANSATAFVLRHHFSSSFTAHKVQIPVRTPDTARGGTEGAQIALSLDTDENPEPIHLSKPKGGKKDDCQ